MNLYEEYVKTEKENVYIRLRISFNKETYHWATSSVKQKGYQLNAAPVTKTTSKCGKYSTETFEAFSGFYKIIYPVNRQSKKRLQHAIEIYKRDRERYLDFFRNRGYIINTKTDKNE